MLGDYHLLKYYQFFCLFLQGFMNELQVNIGRRAMGALSVRYGTQYVTGNIAEAICK